MLRREVTEAWRGYHRDARARTGPLEGNPARTREVGVPSLRDDCAATGAFTSPRARTRGPTAACRRAIWQIRCTLAAQPAERDLRAGRRRSRRIDAGRLGRGMRCDLDVAARCDREARTRWRTHPCR